MQLYNQTTKYTCAAAGLAMVINHYRPKFLLNIDNEFDIWQKTAALPARGSSIFALASYANTQKVPVKVMITKRQQKYPQETRWYDKKEIHIANFSSDLYYRRAKEVGIDIIEGEVRLLDVKKLLKAGHILMVRLFVGVLRGTKANRKIPHFMVLYKHEKGKYHIMDPKRGELKVTEKILRESFEGLEEIKRDSRMLVFGKSKKLMTK